MACSYSSQPPTDLARPRTRVPGQRRTPTQNWLESKQLVEAAQEEVLAERRVLGLARDGLSVEAGSDSSGRMEDAEFRLQKDGWLLISRFFEEQLGLQALGLVKTMTQ